MGHRNEFIVTGLSQRPEVIGLLSTKVTDFEDDVSNDLSPDTLVMTDKRPEKFECFNESHRVNRVGCSPFCSVNHPLYELMD